MNDPSFFGMLPRIEREVTDNHSHYRSFAYPSYESRPTASPCKTCGINLYPRTYPLEVIIDDSGVEIPNIIVPPDTGSSFAVDGHTLSVLTEIAGDDFDATEVTILNRGRFANTLGDQRFYDIVPKWRVPIKTGVSEEEWKPGQPACPNCGMIRAILFDGSPTGVDWSSHTGQQLFTTTLWPSMYTVVSRAILEAAREYRWTGATYSAIDTAWRPLAGCSFTVHDESWPPKRWFYPPKQR